MRGRRALPPAHVAFLAVFPLVEYAFEKLRSSMLQDVSWAVLGLAALPWMLAVWRFGRPSGRRDFRFLREAGRALLLATGTFLATWAWAVCLRIPPGPKDYFLAYTLRFCLLLLAVMPLMAWMDHQAREAARVRRRAEELQWMGRRGGFSPGTLTRTLSRLAAGLPERIGEAERGIVELATLYRQWLILSQRPTVTLAEERGLLQGLLALEGGEGRSLRWRVPEGLEGAAVPPLLLASLVEEALGASPDAALAADVTARPWREGLVLSLRMEGGSPPQDAARWSAFAPEAALRLQRRPRGWEATWRLA